MKIKVERMRLRGDGVSLREKEYRGNDVDLSGGDKVRGWGEGNDLLDMRKVWGWGDVGMRGF